MTITLTLNGETYTAIPTATFERMVEKLGGRLPGLPAKNQRGHRPALATGRVILARKIIRARIAAGWTQEALAKRAKVRVETISRLESGKHEPHHATLVRLEDCFNKAGVDWT
jgi:DNA-binding XRE family transcriptional regulator